MSLGLSASTLHIGTNKTSLLRQRTNISQHCTSRERRKIQYLLTSVSLWTWAAELSLANISMSPAHRRLFLRYFHAYDPITAGHVAHNFRSMHVETARLEEGRALIRCDDPYDVCDPDAVNPLAQAFDADNMIILVRNSVFMLTPLAHFK